MRTKKGKGASTRGAAGAAAAAVRVAVGCRKRRAGNSRGVLLYCRIFHWHTGSIKNRRQARQPRRVGRVKILLDCQVAFDATTILYTLSPDSLSRLERERQAALPRPVFFKITNLYTVQCAGPVYSHCANAC
jgi:hypothetical protein